MTFLSAAAWKHVTTIIIVEDDSSVNLAVSRLLEAAGFDVRSFTSAGALLSDAHAHDADCLVLDVHLPDMNGFDLQRKLVATGFSAPVVVITAHDEPETRDQCIDAGACAYLRKPLEDRLLLNAISAAMRAHSAPIKR